MSSQLFSVNTKDLIVKIKEIKEKVSVLKSQNKSDVDIELFFLDNDTEFYENHPYLIKKLIKGDSLEFLDKMINNMKEIEDGNQSLASTELKLGEELAQKYLYPVIKKD